MIQEIYENLKCPIFVPIEKQIQEMLQYTWAAISVNYVYEYLRQQRPIESISPNDLCRVELRADDVRSAVYSNVQISERLYPSVVEMWFDLDVEEQDRFLTDTFPSTQVYGV